MSTHTKGNFNVKEEAKNKRIEKIPNSSLSGSVMMN